MAQVQFELSHSQIAVFNSRMGDPFNNWNLEHVVQGFASRHGSVSFFVPESGSYAVDLVVRTEFQSLDENAERIIEVPFDVAPEDRVEFLACMEI